MVVLGCFLVFLGGSWLFLVVLCQSLWVLLFFFCFFGYLVVFGAIFYCSWCCMFVLVGSWWFMIVLVSFGVFLLVLDDFWAFLVVLRGSW